MIYGNTAGGIVMNNPENVSVVFSAFADEISKNPVAYLAALSFGGIGYYSARFVDIKGDGNVKHFQDLNPAEVQELLARHDDVGIQVQVGDIGSRVGKTALKEGGKQKYLPVQNVLDDMKLACERANDFGAKGVRMFTFYHPEGDSPEDHIGQSVEWVGKLCDIAEQFGVVCFAEEEVRLVGHNGKFLARVCSEVNHPRLYSAGDVANVQVNGLRGDELTEDFACLLPSLGMLHLKAYAPSGKTLDQIGEEGKLTDFVPVDRDNGDHRAVFNLIKPIIPIRAKKLKMFGLPGFFYVIESHVLRGGQFGGESGAMGKGVAFRAAQSECKATGITYDLHDFTGVLEQRRRLQV